MLLRFERTVEKVGSSLSDDKTSITLEQISADE